MLNKAIGENVTFPEIESVILICNSLEEMFQGFRLSFVGTSVRKSLFAFSGARYFMFFHQK